MEWVTPPGNHLWFLLRKNYKSLPKILWFPFSFHQVYEKLDHLFSSVTKCQHIQTYILIVKNLGLSSKSTQFDGAEWKNAIYSISCYGPILKLYQISLFSFCTTQKENRDFVSWESLSHPIYTFYSIFFFYTIFSVWQRKNNQIKIKQIFILFHLQLLQKNSPTNCLRIGSFIKQHIRVLYQKISLFISETTFVSID